MVTLVAALAFAAPPDYHRNAKVAVAGGLAAALIPPPTSAVVFAVRLSRGPRPSQGSLLIPSEIGLAPVRAINQVGKAAAFTVKVTSPLYPVLPALLLRTSTRARQALLDVGEDVPATWSTLGTVSFGVHLAGGGVAVGLLAASVDAGGAGRVMGAASAVGWAGSVFCALGQWGVDRHHARSVGLAGPAASNERRELEVPVLHLTGAF